MAMYLTAAAVAVGGQLLAGKIASNRANDPKAAIGSGTAPSLQPGGDIQVSAVEGSQVQNFGDFENQNIAESDEMTEQEQLLVMLQQAGFDADGLASLAFGGPVQYKANGSGITSLDRLNMDPELIKQLLSGMNPLGETKQDYLDGIDFESGLMETESLENIMENQIVNTDTTRPEILTGTEPDYTQEIGDQTTFDEIGYYAQENPEIFNAGIGAIGKVLSAALSDVPERKGSIVSTQPLPGKSARRRSAQMNIQPIGGSKVTFANEGTALKRPMFMPNGGQMRGPGGPKDDLIPVMASNGEYMLSKAAVDAAGNGSHAQGLARLDAFNKMGNKRYG
jgi:hypothetical protein